MTGGRGKKNAAVIASAATIGLLNSGFVGAQEAPLPTYETIPNSVSDVGLISRLDEDDEPQGGAPDTPPSYNVEATVRSSLEVDDNGSLRVDSPGTDTRFLTELGLNLESVTATHNLGLSFGGFLQLENKAAGSEENGFEKPFAVLNYSTQGPDSRFRFRGSYRTDDIVDSVFLDTDDDLIEDTLLTSDGQIDRTQLRATYSFGIDAPFGMDFTASRSEVNYSNTVDPDLYDRTTDTLSAVARFRINQAATARLIASLTQFEGDDVEETDRETTDYGVGLSYMIGPDLLFDAEVTQTDIEETTTAGTEENDGISATVALTKELANGAIGIVANRQQFTDTSRSEIGVFRDLSLASGEFSFGVGVSSSDTGDSALVGSINYANEVPSGVITASLRRTATVNNENEEVERTVLGVSYLYEINSVSGIDFGLDYASVKDIGDGSVSDSDRTDISVTYRRQLTEDWDWTLGYVGRIKENDAGDEAKSNAVVTSIGRSFSLRP